MTPPSAGSAVTILAYLIAMPIALWIMALLSPQIECRLTSPWAQNSLLFFGIFLIAGIVLGKLMRMALDDAIGPEAGIADRRPDAVTIRKRQMIYYPIAAILTVAMLGGIYGFINAEETALTTITPLTETQIFEPQTPQP